MKRTTKQNLSTINRLVQPFLHRRVTVKAAGFSIEGSLWRMDSNTTHNPPGLGNLILSDRTVIKGSMVEAICVNRREKHE